MCIRDRTDIVVSPWKSINRKHMTFAIFMGEYRRYFKEHNPRRRSFSSSGRNCCLTKCPG